MGLSPVSPHAIVSISQTVEIQETRNNPKSQSVNSFSQSVSSKNCEALIATGDCIQNALTEYAICMTLQEHMNRRTKASSKSSFKSIRKVLIRSTRENGKIEVSATIRNI
jgi:uncharacterized protein (UPF0218 family)